MKTFLLLLSVFASFAFRPKNEELIQDLQQAYQHVAWKNHGELGYDADSRVLHMMSYRIPVSEGAHVKSQHSQPMVELRLDRDMSVTDVNKPQWSESHFMIPFKNKKSADEFVKAFNKMKQNVRLDAKGD